MVVAPAQIAIHKAEHLFLRGLRILLQQRDRRQDHARHAVAALHGPFGDECLLNRVQGIALGQPFDRGDRLAVPVTAFSWHERTFLSSISTVQEPQSPSPQP